VQASSSVAILTKLPHDIIFEYPNPCATYRKPNIKSLKVFVQLCSEGQFIVPIVDPKVNMQDNVYRRRCRQSKELTKKSLFRKLLQFCIHLALSL